MLDEQQEGAARRPFSCSRVASQPLPPVQGIGVEVHVYNRATSARIARLDRNVESFSTTGFQ
jgi:hypothetical protein